LGISAAAAAGVPAAAVGAQQSSNGRPSELRSELLLDLIVETTNAATIGDRRIVNVIGGTFEGPRLKGTVHPPGADWVLRTSDQTSVLDVRTLLITDDKQSIYCTYRGVIHRPAGGETYWRVTPYFETASPKYDWLNYIVSVGMPFTVPQRVAYRFFQVL